MEETFRDLKICIAANFPPPYGGLATQAITLSKHLTNEGAIVYHLDGIHKIIQVPNFMFKCLKYSIKCDVIHLLVGSNRSFYRFIVLILFASMFKKKIVLMSEGGTEEFLSKKGYIIKPILKLVSSIVNYSEYLEKVYKKHGFKSIIIPDYISKDFIFTFKEIVKPTILMAKSISPEYNYEFAIKAFKVISELYSEAKLIIAGNDKGEYARSIKETVVNLSIAEKVVFLGDVEYSEMPKIYSQCDIFLNTTNTDNFPRCIMEAQASGLIVVASNVGGIPYMIENMVDGILINQTNQEDISSKIIMLLNDQDLSKTIRLNARKKYEENYTWDKVKYKLLDVYKANHSAL